MLPRQTLLYRSNEFRQKLIAANVTQIVIVVATEPSFSEELITRCLVAAESQDIRALIVLKVYEERSYKEIAEIAGLSVGNVGFILHTAMKKLAAVLERGGDDDVN